MDLLHALSLVNKSFTLAVMVKPFTLTVMIKSFTLTVMIKSFAPAVMIKSFAPAVMMGFVCLTAGSSPDTCFGDVLHLVRLLGKSAPSVEVVREVERVDIKKNVCESGV